MWTHLWIFLMWFLLIFLERKKWTLPFGWNLFPIPWLRTVRSLVLIPASLAGCSNWINTRAQWCQFADIGMLTVFLNSAPLYSCFRFLSQCKNACCSKLARVLKVQTCSLSLNLVSFIIICKMFHSHLFNLLSYCLMEPGVNETK